MDSLTTLLLYLPVLLLSVVAHEYAHARVAVAQGDPTPAMLGRVTMNPLPHIDPVGTIVVPAVLWFMQAGFLIGWAKPVETNPRRYRDYRKGDILVSAAGVAANLLLAVGFVALVVVLSRAGEAAGGDMAGALETARRMARFGVLFNILLAVFNLIPLPPLDGSHLLYHLLPPGLGARYRRLGQYSFVLLFLVLLVPGLLGAVLYPVRVLDGLAEDLIRLLA